MPLCDEEASGDGSARGEDASDEDARGVEDRTTGSSSTTTPTYAPTSAAKWRRSYRVREAADGVEALLMARVEIPDLVVSDVTMPEMDGFALLAEVRSDPDLAVVPVILLTARAEHADKLHGLERGADDYLVKPFASDELRARVDGLIQSRRRLRVHYQGETPEAASGDGASGDAASGEVMTTGATPEVAPEAEPEDVFLVRALETARARLSDPTSASSSGRRRSAPTARTSTARSARPTA